MTGAAGADLIVEVAKGTVVTDLDTGETLGDLSHDGDRLLVAKGGQGGRGNTRFKTSVNRAPRQFDPGEPGEKRKLGLALKLLADVGLLGAPNAGKSTLTRAISAARPKVADYPFTTLHPQLGVVHVGMDRSFVVADIPGLIEGAAAGAGLGIRFLKHLERTRLLLHVVDACEELAGGDPAVTYRAVEAELGEYSDALADLPRWLVLNKLDLLPPEQREKRVKAIVRKLRWRGPVYGISALAADGTKRLAQDVMAFLEEQRAGRDGRAVRASRVAWRSAGSCSARRGSWSGCPCPPSGRSQERRRRSVALAASLLPASTALMHVAHRRPHA